MRGHFRTGTEMNLTRELLDMGQSLWLDNIMRGKSTAALTQEISAAKSE